MTSSRPPMHGERLRQFIDRHAAEIAERYQAGATIVKLCAEYGQRRQAINAALDAMGIERVPGGQVLLRRSSLRDEDVQRLLAEGYTVRNIADELGVSVSQVYGRIRSRGWPNPSNPRRAPEQLSDEDVLALIDLIGERIPARLLADEFGVSAQTIYWYRKRLSEAGWHCQLRWTLCPICGWPACSARATYSVHPVCEQRWDGYRAKQAMHGQSVPRVPARTLTRDEVIRHSTRMPIDHATRYKPSRGRRARSRPT